MKNPETQSLTRTRAQLSADFVDLDQLYSALYNRCSREQLLWHPGAGSWGIAECIEHVARAILQYLAPMRQAILKGGPSAPEENYLFAPGGWFSAAFLRRIGPQVSVRFKSARKIRPLQIDPEKAFDELRRGHRETQRTAGENRRI
jgi:DinB superfamily